MAIVDDPNLYLDDFAVSVVAENVSGRGILDAPGEVIIDGMVMMTDYSVTCPSYLFGDLTYGAAIQVDGNDYTVKENKPQQDGLFCVITLERVTLPVAAPEF